MIPLVFILFLFGFTLITVSPVIAEDSPEFVACQQIKPRDIQTLKNKKDCFRDLARALVTGGAVAQANGADSPEQVSTSPSGGEVAELNARIAESESQVATLTTTNAQLQEQLMSASAALEPLNAKVAELETRVSAANAAQEPLNAKVTELETQVSAASAALDQANENIAKLNNYVETTASTYKAREASITEQYMTLTASAKGWSDLIQGQADKLQIHEQGVAHVRELSEKLLGNLKDKSGKGCLGLGERITLSNKAARAVVSDITYGLSCVAFKLQNGAAAECGPDIVGKY
jgi:DNA repair exonuclease SbcCD ATPase subunit